MSKSIKAIVLSMVVLSFLFAGCTRYANEDEMRSLEDKQAAVKKAETKLSDIQKERRKLETKLADAQTELKKAEEEKSAVESRLK